MTDALLVGDHGSRRPDAHAHLEELVSELRGAARDLRIELAHLEIAEPDIATAIDRLVAEGVQRIAVHPLFLAPGNHLTSDIPAALKAARERHPEIELRQLASIGEHPELAALILSTLR